MTTAGQPDRTYTSIAQARSDGNNARVWGGMHYPSTVAISDAEGEAIAAWISLNAMQPLRKPATFVEPLDVPTPNPVPESGSLLLVNRWVGQSCRCPRATTVVRRRRS